MRSPDVSTPRTVCPGDRESDISNEKTQGDGLQALRDFDRIRSFLSADRTVISYLAKPLAEQIQHTFRED